MELIEAEVTAAGGATVRTARENVQVAAPGDLAAARAAVLGAANDIVRERGEACHLVIVDQGARHEFAIHPDGSRVPITGDERPDTRVSVPRSAAVSSALVEDVPRPMAAGTHHGESDSGEPRPATAQPAANTVLPVEWKRAPFTMSEQGSGKTAYSAGEPARSDVAPSRRSLREVTFLTSDDAEAPATKGLRSLLRFVGVQPKPSAAELAEREDTRTVSQHWPGPRTIAVVNRKGGSNKTPTVAALSAVFARNGGGGVLAWDNNENQGTLGWRTEQGHHGASVLDLLRDEDRLMSPTASQGLMAGYVHHQGADKYDVLRSDENDQGDHEIEAGEVHLAHAIAERYYRLIIMDSGNTARAANWRAMIEHTDQLVVPTTTMEDRAEAARSLLVTLEDRDEHSARLSARAVVIISQWKPDDRVEAQRIAALFEELGRTVVTVPFDPALKAGRIRYEALRPATKRAWLAAAAAVGRGL